MSLLLLYDLRHFGEVYGMNFEPNIKLIWFNYFIVNYLFNDWYFNNLCPKLIFTLLTNSLVSKNGEGSNF